MTKQVLRAIASCCVIAAAVGCTYIGGDYPAQASVPMTADEVASAALLRGPAWMPIPIARQAGASVRQVDLKDGVVYVVDSAQTLHAIDASTGEHRWVLALRHMPTEPVAVGPQHVVLISERHMTVASRDSGTLLAARDLDFAPSSGVALTADTLYAGSWGDGYRLRTVNLFDGWPGWFYPADGPITAAPLVLGGGADLRLFFASHDGSIVAMDPRSSVSERPEQPTWRTRTLGANRADMGYDEAMLYVPADGLYALARSVGSIQWKWLGAGMALTEAPQVGADTVYQPFGTSVAAIDKATGIERYRVDSAERFVARIGQHDYFKLPGTALAVVDAQTGERITELRSPLLEMVPSNPMGSMVIFSDGSTLYALE